MDKFGLVSNAVSLAMATLSVVFCLAARRQVKHIKHATHHVINGIDEDWQEEPEEDEAEVIKLDGTRNTRVS